MKKILITGPESSGKTQLAQTLAKHFAGTWVPEYARKYLGELDRPYEEADLLPILQGQLHAQLTAASTNSNYLFCDTGPEVIYLWSQVKYGRIALEIVDKTTTEEYDLRLLCYPDLNWAPDPLREAADLAARLRLWQAYVALHEQMNWPYTIIRGQGNVRTQAAIAEVASIL